MSDESYIIADHCGTVYSENNGHGDIGQNIAEDRPEVLNVKGPEDFIEKVKQLNQEGYTERESDGLGHILAYESDENLERILEEGLEAQHPEDYGDGFVELCKKNPNVHIVTAGIEDIAEDAMKARMNGYTPEVTGTQLAENGDGTEVERYCSGDEKLERARNYYGVDSLGDIPSIAMGNSDSNDGPMMEEARIAIGRGRAYDSSDIYTEEDLEVWTRATLAEMSSAVLEGDDPMERGRQFLESCNDDPTLEEIDLVSENELAREVAEAYEEIRR
jgi:phosphoserine phosphatase